jgi:hypothetical protein
MDLTSHPHKPTIPSLDHGPERADREMVVLKSETIEQAREHVAKAAERHGETWFAREVRSGVWDHRSDVQACLKGTVLKGEAE